MRDFLWRFVDASMPYQTWKPFPDEAIVQVKNSLGESRIGQVKDLWWGYEAGNVEGVIVKVRRLDRPRTVEVPSCVNTCQYAEDCGLSGQYSCSNVCVYSGKELPDVLDLVQ